MRIIILWVHTFIGVDNGYSCSEILNDTSYLFRDDVIYIEIEICVVVRKKIYSQLQIKDI